jgi:hypothetical protein
LISHSCVSFEFNVICNYRVTSATAATTTAAGTTTTTATATATATAAATAAVAAVVSFGRLSEPTARISLILTKIIQD